MPERIGVHIGSGIGGFDVIEREHTALIEGGPRKISPFLYSRCDRESGGGPRLHALRRQGPNEATATACTTSAHSIGDSFRIIQHGDADVMIAGGTEAAITPMGVGGFAAMRALSTRNDDPEKASRPWDTRPRRIRDAAKALASWCLKNWTFARARGAKILAEIVGYGMSRRRLPHHAARARARRRIPRDEKCAARCQD